jgi:O-antigen/teichoic acid export membrane protein
MDRVAIAEFLGKIAQLSLVYFAIQQNWGLLIVTFAVTLSMIVNFSIILFLSRRYVPWKLRYDPSYWKTFLRMSYPAGISTFLVFLYLKTDTLILSVLQESQDVGIYGAAFKIIENLVFFPAMVIGLVLPLFSRHILSDRDMFRQIADKTFTFFLLLVVPMLISVQFLAEDIILILGGEEYAQSVNILRILIFSLGFMFFGNFFMNILYSGNQQKRAMILLAVVAVFNIGANFLFIPRYSYYAPAVISVITEALVALLTGIFTYLLFGYLPQFERFVRILLSGAGMALVLYLSRDMAFVVAIVLGGLSYVLFVWLTKAVTQQELVLLFKRDTSSLTKNV